MEIYKDSATRTVTLAVPLTPLVGTEQAFVYDLDGNCIAEINEFEDTEDGVSINLPFFVIDNYDEFEVQFNFEYMEQSVSYEFTRTVSVEVVTPFLTISEVKAIIGSNKTDAQALDAERLVRLIIYSHCGQEFNRAKKKYILRGNGKNYIELPNRLLQLTSFNGFTDLPTNFRITSDGWFIRAGVVGVPNIKADYDGYHEINGRIYNEFGILPQHFNEWIEYTVDGYWGWKDVPTEVKEAAKLLINDYACDDSLYRDRYIDAVSAVDWKIQFSTGAFANTGNVKADQLLAPFVLNRGWAVI